MKKYLLVGLMAFSGVSNAALITSNVDAALTGSTVINFDGTSTQNALSFTFGDVTFSTTGGTLKIAPFGEGGSAWMGSGQTLTTRNTSSPSAFSIDFGTAVSAFGMNWGAADPDWSVNLFDTSNNLLENIVFIGGTNGGGISSFYGASNSAISRVELTSVSGFDWVIVDDFQYVASGGVSNVPAPAVIWLLSSGLIGLIGLKRNLSKAPVPSA